MSTSDETVDHILDRMSAAGAVRARRMFGEHGVYCDDRFVGVICAGQLFLKPTEAGAALEPDLDRAPPYEGAKPSMIVPDDLLDDPDRLAALVRATADALLAPKTKTAKRKKAAHSDE